MKWLAVVSVLVLGACAQIPDVDLKHPENGSTVTCVGYFGTTFYTYAETLAKHEDCIAYHETRGYVRISEDNSAN